MNIESDRIVALPVPSLVLLLGARGSGKSTFASRHFSAESVVSLDVCRKMVGDGGASPSAAAFEVFYSIIEKRLEAGKLVVVDADVTHVDMRRNLVSMARKHHLFAIAIVFDLDFSVCVQRNASRADEFIAPHVVKRQVEAIRSCIKGLAREGIRDVHILSTEADIEAAVVVKTRLWTDRREDHGPFDIIGDVHGCADELEVLLETLGYRITWDDCEQYGVRVTAPEGRRAIFLGDLIDRGPRIVDTLRIAMTMVSGGTALCVPGNHEVKLLKKLRGKQVTITHGLAETVAELDGTTQAFRDEVALFIESLVGHYLLDDGKLCVVHAGIKERMQGRSSSAAREFGLYGDTSGETDEYGLPVRHEWATEYQGKACIVFGHTPMLTAEWLNNTICIDTGCVFGGALTALRYPERELVSVPASRKYFDPKKPLTSRTSKAGENSRLESLGSFDFDSPKEQLLDYDILRSGGVFKTRFRYDVPIREENAAAVMELMSRFAVDPEWLVYLPPAISPVDPGHSRGALEHPTEAFAYYQKKGVSRVVCQEKRDGTRVVAIVCQDAHLAREAFGVKDGRTGIVYTRSGRSYFDDRNTEDAFIEKLRRAIEPSGLFAEHGPFVVLEADIVPERKTKTFSVDLASIDDAMEHLARAAARGVDVESLRQRLSARKIRLSRFVQANEHRDERQVGPDNLVLHVVQILATREKCWLGRNFSEQAAWIDRFVQADPQMFRPVGRIEVVLGDASSESAALSFWDETITNGVSAMVVCPAEPMNLRRSGLTLPALVCRSPQALRFILGPEYDAPDNLSLWAKRSHGALRAITLGQHALGLEALSRFVEGEPLHRVHACVCVALALECENMDSRAG